MSILIGVSPKARTWIVAGVLVLISILVGREVFLRLIAPAPPLNFDEAAHSLPGYYMLRDFRNLDLRAFWGDFHIQTLWPPGFSMMQAPFLGVLGLTDDAARLFAYIMLVATALVACAIAYQISPELAPLAGLVSGLIALSAPGWLFVGSWAMQETPVAFVVFVAFWCFLQALKTQRKIWFFLTGCALYFAFLTKFNYAAFAIAAVGIVDLGERLRLIRAKNNERVQARPFSILNSQFSILALYAPLVAGILFWFFGGTDIVPTEVKWRDFRFFVTNEDSGYPFWSAENLLFYVRTMFDWLMPSPWLAAASLLGAAWAVVRIRHPGVTLLAIYFVLGFVLATAHQLKADRYITPLFPSLWLLTGLGAAELVKEIGDWRLAIARRGSHSPISIPQSPFPNLQSLIPILALFAITSWSWLTWLPRLQPVWAGHLADDLRAASHQIVRWQQADRPVLIIGTFGELSPPLFEWRLRPLPAFANTPHPIQYDAPPVEGPNDIARVQRWLDENPGAQVTLIRVDE
ncbi:MAG: glycosyltransferase family 39 protein, partial [Caldilinea sp.]|nr:glycosyltransferase family 39 protein [Caldilinea sp.]MDW8441594.1 glycosyltransferase family 39 protein [Caldilineaceae bacterium]